MFVTRRSAIMTLAILVTLGGLGLGALLALVSHRGTTTQTVAVSTPAVTIAATAAPTVIPTRKLSVAPAVRATVVATMVPTKAPTTAPTVAPTLRPTVRPAVAPIVHVASHTWVIDEANVVDGEMVWVGSAVQNGGLLTLKVHKQRVGDRAAVPCEAQTQLQLTIAQRNGPQSVPYSETNCTGAQMTGTVQVASFTGGDLRGSFWDGSRKLGDFSASAQ